MLVLITLKPQFNEADPERYKAGFDGGVDFIATFDVVKPIHRNVCFYIQCKCHKEPLTKTAIRHTNVNRDKNNNFNTKTNSLPLFHQSQSNQIYPKFTKTCERAGKRKISVLETHYFLLKLYKMICYVKSCFLRSLLFTILTILRLFSKISSPNTGCLDSLHPQRATLFIRLSAKNAANLISYRGVRRISA